MKKKHNIDKKEKIFDLHEYRLENGNVFYTDGSIPSLERLKGKEKDSIRKVRFAIAGMDITDLILLDLEGNNKEEALLNIAKYAKEKGLVKNEQSVYQKFLERERKGTTGIGNGIALPEACWIEMTRPYAFILCRTKEPVDFKSLDNKPVRIILASLGGDKNKLTRLRPMANLTRLLKSNQFRNSLLKAKDQKEVHSLFEKMRPGNE